MQDSLFNGTHDWTHFSFTLPVSDSAIDIVFGCLMSGTGESWFDDLEIDLNGTPYTPPPPFSASAPQLGWLKKAAVALTTADPSKPLTDLGFLDNFVRGATIVGLGEATHGTSEFFHMKHRLLRYLVEREGFTIFAIEANMPECYRLNEYVLSGQGDPEMLLKGIYFWTWNTQEVLDMIKWMRAYNAGLDGHDGKKLQFTGFDMQIPQVADTIAVRMISEMDPEFTDSARHVLLTTPTSPRSIQEMNEIKSKAAASEVEVLRLLDHLLLKRQQYLQHSTKDSVDWMIQNVRIVQQALSLEASTSNYSIRDSCMAWNIGWIRDHNPGQKIVLWAHNGHIQKDSLGLFRSMGACLSEIYQQGYRNIGFAFDSGTYTAKPRNMRGKVQTFVAPAARPGSLEAQFHRIGEPLFFLDLRRVLLSSDTNAAWITREMPVRFIGAVETNDYENVSLSTLFDGIIFSDRSTASQLLIRGH
jgi:erythromycin esterase